MGNAQIWLILIGIAVVFFAVLLYKFKLVRPASMPLWRVHALLLFAIVAPLIGLAISWLCDQ